MHYREGVGGYGGRNDGCGAWNIHFGSWHSYRMAMGGGKMLGLRTSPHRLESECFRLAVILSRPLLREST